MTDRPTLSAFVIVYNGMKFLPDLLASLRADLESIDHELFLIDNGSTDGSIEWLRQERRDLRLIENGANLGFARAVNIGLTESRGEFVYILNQDLRFPPGATTRLLDRLKSELNLGMIGPGYVDFSGRPQHSARALPSYRHVIYHALFLDRLFPRSREFGHWKMSWLDHAREAYVEQPMGAVMLLPRTVIDKVGPMDESFPLLFNDVDWCRRIKAAGFKLLYYPEVTVRHYVGGSTSRRPYQLKITSHSSMYRYLRKYARRSEYPLLWLCGLLLVVGLAVMLPLEFLRRLFSGAGSSS